MRAHRTLSTHDVFNRRKGADRRIAGPADGCDVQNFRRAAPWRGEHWAGAPGDAERRAASRGEGALPLLQVQALETWWSLVKTPVPSLACEWGT